MTQSPEPPLASEAQTTPPDPGGRSEQTKSRVAPLTLKILVVGGLGAGKTTCVGAVSEIKPLRLEEVLPRAGSPVDYISLEENPTTTVAMDFGRITLREDLVLYLFGIPGQEGEWFPWDGLATGALGAIVLADTRLLEDCFVTIDYFERRSIPFVIGINCFDGTLRYPAEDIRRALDLDADVPIVMCDARERESVKEVLVSVVQHAMTQAAAERHQSVIN